MEKSSLVTESQIRWELGWRYMWGGGGVGNRPVATVLKSLKKERSANYHYMALFMYPLKEACEGREMSGVVDTVYV
jgi:hypothetical protein